MGNTFLEHVNGDKLYLCVNCNTNITSSRYQLSKDNDLRTGIGYLFYLVVNVNYSHVEPEKLITGDHFIRHVMCKKCGSRLGWMFEFATEPDQRYREGRVTLKREMIKKINGFPNTD